MVKKNTTRLSSADVLVVELQPESSPIQNLNGDSGDTDCQTPETVWKNYNPIPFENEKPLNYL
jgi:hypothetical protein